MQLVNPLRLPVQYGWPVSMAMHSEHPWPDADKVAVLAAEMVKHGWVGPPIVAWDDLAFTGTHRLEAWKIASGDEAPWVDLVDILNAYGRRIDPAATGEVCGDEFTTIDLVTEAVGHLPGDVTDAYGLDLDW